MAWARFLSNLGKEMTLRKIAFIEVEESQIFHEGTFK